MQVPGSTQKLQLETRNISLLSLWIVFTRQLSLPGQVVSPTTGPFNNSCFFVNYMYPGSLHLLTHLHKL